ncbi:MAG: tetratricopeptide repeat protein [Pseudomonadota bacterium]
METLKELLSVGKQYFDNKQYAQAEEYLRRVLDKSGHFADVLNMLGVISHVEGRFASSIDYFRKALEINPRYTEAILNLAVLYNDLGQYAEAKKLYSSLKGRKAAGNTQIEPVLRGKLSNLHADIGDIYRSIGLYSHAIGEYHKALELNPTYFDIRTKLGQAQRENNQPAESLKELKAVLRADGNYCPALIQMGITYYTMGKIPDAKKSWKAALAKEPDNEYAQMYLRLCDATQRGESAPAAAAPPPKKAASPQRGRARR